MSLISAIWEQDVVSKNEKAILSRTEKAIMRAMCGVKMIAKRSQELMRWLGLKDTLDVHVLAKVRRD